MPTPDLPIDEAFRKLRLAVVDETGGRRPEARDDLNTPIVLLGAEGATSSATVEATSDPGALVPPASPNETRLPSNLFSDAPLSGSLLQPLNQDVAVALPDNTVPDHTLRASYYFQGSEGQAGEASEGTAARAGIDWQGHPAIQATILIPDRHITATVTIHKNYDSTLPTTHLIEMAFSGMPSISRVPALVPKQSEEARGQPLAGAAVPVTSELFWIALSSDSTDSDRNVQLLREGSWFDIPILYNDETRALFTFEKGALGDKVFETVMSSW